MGGFKERMQGAIAGTKSKVQDLKINSKLQKADLCTYSEAWKIVYPIFEELFGRENWSEPATGQDTASFRAELEVLMPRLWGENYDPTKVNGSVATIYNLTVVYLICRTELKVDSKTFFGALDWALQESSMEDVFVYFESDIFSDSPKIENLSVLLPSYCKDNFPEIDISEKLEIVKKKIEQLQDLHEYAEDGVYFSSGLRESYITQYKGPRASFVRYLEYYEPLFLDEIYVGPFFNLDSSLKYVSGAVQEHWLFCQERILILPEKNDQSGILIISKEEVRKITFGYAMTGATRDGNVVSSIYKMYIKVKFDSGLTITKFKYLGTQQHDAKREAAQYRDGILELIADHWKVEWSDDIIDEFTHYTTTPAKPTYNYWGFGE
jgi:hypothetical protein